MPKDILQRLPKLITDTYDCMTEPQRRADLIATTHQLVPDLFRFHNPISDDEFKSRVEAMDDTARLAFVSHADHAIGEIRTRSQGRSAGELGLLVEVPVESGVSIGVLFFARKPWGQKNDGKIDMSFGLGVSIIEQDHRFEMFSKSGVKKLNVVSKSMTTSYANAWDPRNYPDWVKKATTEQAEQLVELVTFISDGLNSGELTPVALNADMNEYALGLC